MIKYALLLALVLFSLIAVSAVVAGRGGVPNYRAKPHAVATPTPTCQTEITQTTLSGTSSIDITVSRGETVFLRMATALNWTDGDQWWTTKVGYFAEQPETHLPAEWVAFNPAQFCLTAGDYQQVNIWLTVPRKANADTYFGLLQFSVCKPLICAAVAIKATITVE